MLTVLILLTGLVIVEDVPPLEVPIEEERLVFKCEHGFVHIRLTYYDGVEVWVRVADKKTGKLIGCNDI